MVKVSLMAALAAAALLAGAEAGRAVVGGRDEGGALMRASVMVLDSRGGVCSAVVVARDVVLTAAHCVTGADQHRVHFRDEDGQPALIAPSAVAVHPGYDPKAVETRRRSIDLALVRLPKGLPARFEPAALSDDGAVKGETVTLGGWGVGREDEAHPSGRFRAASLSAVEPYGPSRILIWAQDPRGAAGACRGDSGGPIAVGERVVAVTTWASGQRGRACGHYSQGALLGPQRGWIDGAMGAWGREARWE